MLAPLTIPPLHILEEAQTVPVTDTGHVVLISPVFPIVSLVLLSVPIITQPVGLSFCIVKLQPLTDPNPTYARLPETTPIG